MPTRWGHVILGCASFLMLLPLSGRAQSFNATITGSVVDQSGAAVPGAALTLTAIGTGVQANSTSGPDGLFRFPNLVAGAYTLKVSAKGFRDYEQTGIAVNINQVINVNVSLSLGAAIQTIEVSANASPLNYENAVVKQAITPQVIEDLPILVSGNQRSAAAFAILVPGVSTGAGNDPFDARINGGLQTGDEAVLDGISMQQGLMNQGGMISMYNDFPISPDTVSEVSVLTSNYEPQYGNTTSAVITAVTKSGTNQYHGTGYELLRNTVLNARNFGAVNRSEDIENDWGFTIGGRIRIPRYSGGNRKAFFFLGFDQYWIRGGTNHPVISIPTQQEIQGNFSDWVDSSGNLIPIYDPASTQANPNYNSSLPNGPNNLPFLRTQFMGCGGGSPNVICPTGTYATQIAYANNWLKYMPKPTNPGLANNYIVPTAFSNLGGSSVDHKNLPTLKIDYYIGERDHFAAIVYISDITFGNVTSLPPQIASEDHSYNHSGPFPGSPVDRLNWDHTFSPTILNSLNYGYLNFQGIRDSVDRTYVSTLPQIAGVGSHFLPTALAFQDYATMGDNAYNYERRPTNIVNDLVTWVHGKHTIKFGGELRKLELSNLVLSGVSGNFSFSRLNTGLIGINSGNDMASFLIGAVSSGSSLFPTVPTFYMRDSQWDLNAGDTWKVTSKLSVNYGVRWDVATPSVDKFDHLSFLDPNGGNPEAGNLPGRLAFAGSKWGEASFGARHPENTWFRGFSPRVGFAYSRTPKTVIRSGYGIFYTQMFYPGWAGGSALDGFNATPSFSSSNGGITPAFLLENGFPQNFQHPPFIDSGFDNGQSGPNYRPFNSNRLPYAQQWNLTVEHQFTPNFYLDVAYVGNKGTRMPSATDPINALNPSLLSMGQQLFDVFQPGQTTLDGVSIPYSGWVDQMTACAPTVAQALSRYPQYCGGLAGETENAGNSTYHSLQVKAEKRFSNGFWFLGSYTNSKLITDSNSTQSGNESGGLVQGVISPFERHRNKTLAIDDVPQLLSLTVVYDLPVGKGKRYLNVGGITNKILGGWEASTIFRASSGIPFIFRDSNCNVPAEFHVACLPAVVSGNPFAMSKGSFEPEPNAPLFNRAAFQDNGTEGFQFAYGSGAVVSNYRGYGFHNQDFGLTKDIRITERVGVQFKVEAFNLWNWHNLACMDQCTGNTGFVNDLASPSFGTWNGAVSPPRNIQAGMKILF